MFTYIDFPSWIDPKVVPFLPIRWYGVIYVVAFSIAYLFFTYQIKHDSVMKDVDFETASDAFFYTILGIILGGRIFSTLFYEGDFYYWTHPWMIFWPFRSGEFIGLPGMSYHGAAIGGVLGNYLYCKKKKLNFAEVSDVIFTGVPLGYTLGRIGNFINGELWGRCTGSSYGIVFPHAEYFSTTLDWVREAADKAGISYFYGEYVNLPRHPSQLYEAFFEGIVLFILIWFVMRPWIRSGKSKFGNGFLGGFYIAFYGFVRFIIEYFREPDEQIGFVIALGKETEPLALFRSLFNISFGQILCLAMVILGSWNMIRSRKSVSKEY